MLKLVPKVGEKICKYSQKMLEAACNFPENNYHKIFIQWWIYGVVYSATWQPLDLAERIILPRAVLQWRQNSKPYSWQFFFNCFFLLFSCIFACSVYVPHPHSKNLLLVSLNIASGPCNATAMTMAALGLGGFGAPGLVSLCPTFCLPLIFLLMLIIPMIDFFYQCQSGWYLHYLHYLHKYGIFLTQYTNTRFLWNTWKMEHNVVQTEDEM